MSPAPTQPSTREEVMHEETLGKIITFYSYKGGTGRSMALANVAWILAASQHRVLVIDWDFEAPGLHYYFRPFLDDPELLETRGLLDFFWEFLEASRVQADVVKQGGKQTEREGWFLPFTDLTRYAQTLDYEFGGEATLDIVCAGRQGPTYSMKVNTFSWNDFYDKLGGGVFLEHVKKRLRAEYDYVLIDSRTGLSDIAGICTVQMPDEVMMFFTLNRQSIQGVAAIANSLRDQRRQPSGEPSLRLWPVPTRVDQAEKERLEAAMLLAEETFRNHLWHLPREERHRYWAEILVPYIPYYAYEEVLATIADRMNAPSTLLAAMERLAGRLAGQRGLQLPMPQGDAAEQERVRILQSFGVGRRAEESRPSRVSKPLRKERLPAIFISHSPADVPSEQMRVIISMLRRQLGADFFWDRDIMPKTAVKDDPKIRSLREADVVLCFVGPEWLKSRSAQAEVGVAIQHRRQLMSAVLEDDISWEDLPYYLHPKSAFPFSLKKLDVDVMELVGILERFLRRTAKAFPAVNAEDPQKGQWGGKSRMNGRVLEAQVREVTKHWFEVTLNVRRVSGPPLTGRVRFHLHDTFQEPIAEVMVQEGAAQLVLNCWGAFTVGAETDKGETLLELDLAELEGIPEVFRLS